MGTFLAVGAAFSWTSLQAEMRRTLMRIKPRQWTIDPVAEER
jgi:hypothetical protein